MILFELSMTFLLSVGLLIAAGICDMVSVVIRSTLVPTLRKLRRVQTEERTGV